MNTTNKVECHDCLNCKVFKDNGKTKVKCSEGRWWNANGDEKVVAYRQNFKKTKDGTCRLFQSMSE